LQGEFSAKNIKEVKDAVGEALSVGHVQIAFDLEKTTFIDSTAIGLIMNIHKKLLNKDGEVYLVAIPPDQRDSLNTSGILQVIPHYSNFEEAEREIS